MLNPINTFIIYFASLIKPEFVIVATLCFMSLFAFVSYCYIKDLYLSTRQFLGEKNIMADNVYPIQNAINENVLKKTDNHEPQAELEQNDTNSEIIVPVSEESAQLDNEEPVPEAEPIDPDEPHVNLLNNEKVEFISPPSRSQNPLQESNIQLENVPQLVFEQNIIPHELYAIPFIGLQYPNGQKVRISLKQLFDAFQPTEIESNEPEISEEKFGQIKEVESSIGHEEKYKSKKQISWIELLREPDDPIVSKQKSGSSFQSEDSISKSKIPNEYNILLLGETGAGKSTTINALANYLKYSSFEEAKASKFIELIPSKFSLADPSNKRETIDICSDNFDNELCGKEGCSQTQSPRDYEFRVNDGIVRIIDTPGIGDTRGEEFDKRNFEKIFRFLKKFSELHAVCILLRSNETRATAAFRYCVTELLSHLHQGVCKNFVFCFTYARNSDYGAGEGFELVKRFLHESLLMTNLELKPKVNCFFFDNEAYRFLFARNRNYPFDANQEEKFCESWNKSAANANAMLIYIKSLEPHYLRDSVLLNEVRNNITELTEPLVKIALLLEKNRLSAEAQRDSAGKEFREESPFVIELQRFKVNRLTQPKLACTQCVEYENGEMVYNSDCHVGCNCVDSPSVAEPTKICLIMDSLGKCGKCKCDADKHILIRRTFAYEKVSRSYVDLNDIVTEIMKLTDAIEEELKRINQKAAEFGYLLEEYANMSQNNRFLEHNLNRLIEHEESRYSHISDYSSTKKEFLSKFKIDYQKHMEKLRNESPIELEQIDELRNELFGLPISGNSFRKILTATLDIE